MYFKINFKELKLHTAILTILKLTNSKVFTFSKCMSSINELNDSWFFYKINNLIDNSIIKKKNKKNKLYEKKEI